MYSRATTSEIAERPFFGLVVAAFGVDEGFSLGIVSAARPCISTCSLARCTRRGRTAIEQGAENSKRSIAYRSIFGETYFAISPPAMRLFFVHEKLKVSDIFEEFRPRASKMWD